MGFRCPFWGVTVWIIGLELSKTVWSLPNRVLTSHRWEASRFNKWRVENGMMSWERLPWIGIGIVLAAVMSFVIGAVLVRRGKRTRAYLFDETIQDVGFVCLGVSFVFDQGTTPRVWFMAGFVLFFGAYVARRIWRHAKGNTGDQPESE